MPIIETDRLILRPWTMDDAEDLYEYAKDDRVGPNAGWPPHTSIELSKSIIEEFMKSDEVLAIVLKSENKVIGGTGIHKRVLDEALKDLKQRDIGYVLNPKYWGQGLVPEAVNALIDYGFVTLDLDIIWCGHYDFNDKSKRVIDKCGFKYRFTTEKRLKLLNDKNVTLLVYAIDREEYKGK